MYEVVDEVVFGWIEVVEVVWGCFVIGWIDYDDGVMFEVFEEYGVWLYGYYVDVWGGGFGVGGGRCGYGCCWLCEGG